MHWILTIVFCILISFFSHIVDLQAHSTVSHQTDSLSSLNVCEKKDRFYVYSFYLNVLIVLVSISTLYYLRRKYQDTQRKLMRTLIETSNQEREILNINHVTQVVNSTLDLDKVVLSTMEVLQSIFEFNQIGIGLIDEQTQYLSFQKVYGAGYTDEKRQALKTLLLSLTDEDSLFVKVFLKKEVVYIETVTSDLLETFSQQDRAIYDISQAMSFIVYPLIVQQETIGIIAFGNSQDTFNMDAQVIARIQRYVLKIASAINNARLYEALKTTRLQLAESEKVIKLTYSLHEQEKELRNLLDNINLGVFQNTGEPEGKFIKANPALVRMFGYASLEEFMQISADQLFYSATERIRYVTYIKKHGKCKDLKLRLKKKAGTLIWVSISASAQFDAEGAIKWIDGIVEDITAEKETSERMRRMNVAFEKFVPKQFLNRLGNEKVEDIKLGIAQNEVLTILFADLRSFTSLSETLPPQNLLNFLNAYFERMNEPIHRYEGYIDKFIGDAIMALFDSPNTSAKNAVMAAIAMQEALQKYNQDRDKAGYQPVSAGIGIHSGPVVIGTVGSKDRMDSTVLGDNVNLASRLEGLTKYYGAHIIISYDTFSLLENFEKFFYRELDWIRVKGKQKPMQIYEIFDFEAKKERKLKRQSGQFIQQGLYLRQTRQWDESIQAFEQALNIYPQDIAAEFHINQMLKLRENPPIGAWDGASQFDSK